MPSVVYKYTDMAPEWLEKAAATAKEAMTKYCTEQEIASWIKKKFESIDGHTWHVFVGRNFSSYVTHEKGKYAYFYIGQMGFVIFST
jgi:dynein light chain LC8-type